MSVPTQILTVAGRYRENRGGRLTVQITARDMAEIVIHMPPTFDGAPGAEQRIVFAGENLLGLIAALAEAETYRAGVEPYEVEVVAS